MEENKSVTIYDAQLLARRIAERAYLNSEEEIAGWIMEFASLYERQQQENGLPEYFKKFDEIKDNLMTKQNEKIQQLEAERSELRNKVIEECTDKLKILMNEYSPKSPGKYTIANAIGQLNSLKTK